MSDRKPKANLWEDTPFVPDLRVYEEETAPIDTGLLDANGTKIFKQPARREIGFDLKGGRRG